MRFEKRLFRTPLSSSHSSPQLNPGNRAHRCGFTIVEVVMATAVMTLAITTCIMTMQRGFLSVDTARKLTTAGQILQCEVEKMRMLKWTEINAYPASDPMPLDPIFSTNSAVASHFTLRRDTSVVPTTTGVGMKQVTFTVSWKSYDGRPQSRNYTTYYGEHGLYDYYYNQL